MDRPVAFRDYFPILAAANLAASLELDTNLLGFAVRYRWPDAGPVEVAHLELGNSGLGVGRREERHRFSRQPFAHDGVPTTDLYVYVNDLDRAIAFLSASNVPILVAPVTQPWGERIAYVGDHDGNQLLIIETLVATGRSKQNLQRTWW